MATRTCLFVAVYLGGCSQLIGESFDGYHERAADSTLGAQPSQAGSPARALPGPAADSGGRLGASALELGDEHGLPCPDSEPTAVYRFDRDVEGWQGYGTGDFGESAVAFDDRDGSPDPGALRVRFDFPEKPAAGALGARVGLDQLPAAPSCIRARLKIAADSPPPSDLATAAAGWYFWANANCFGQLLTPGGKGWYNELSKSGAWYTLVAPTASFSGFGCNAFDATRITRIGVGFASNFREPWNAEFIIDQVELY